MPQASTRLVLTHSSSVAYEVREIGDRIESKGTLIKDIRIAPYGGIAPRVRIVLDLSAGQHYEISVVERSAGHAYAQDIRGGLG